jgi:hypothetical protein
MGLLAWLNHAKRISQLEEGYLKLLHRMDECELDWTESRARCKRLLDRTEKAQRYVDQAEAAVESEQAVPQASNGGAAVTGRLTDHQKQVQQQILKRRAGGF